MGSPSANEGEFGFGFNDIKFSDRVLYLHIIPDCHSNMNSGGRKHSSWLTASDGTGFEVKKLYISSLILAAKSQYFYRLFKNDNGSLQPTDKLTLSIYANGEAALMDVLKFIYGIPITASSAQELVDVLTVADKFEVSSCIRHCIRLLPGFPMSTKLAVLYLDLPSNDEYKKTSKLYCAAVTYLIFRFRDFTKSQEEAMDLPLSAIEIVLGIDGLQVDSEDAVFDFILKWARLHYPGLEERRKIITKRLVPYICLHNMSSLKLMEVVDCSDFGSEHASKLMLSALISKDDVLNGLECDYRRRVYNYRLVKVVQLRLARPQCVVYFDLSKIECGDLYPSKRLYSQTFFLGGQHLRLVAHCSQEPLAFGLYLIKTESLENCTLDFEFAVMNKSSMEFKREVKANNIFFEGDKERGCSDLFGVSWTDFMGDDSEYFVHGILHLRAYITLIS